MHTSRSTTQTQAPVDVPWIDGTPAARRPRLRLLCFPYAGGTAAVYQTWNRYLGSMVDVCPVHLPGHGRRLGEPLVTDAATLVDAAVSALADACDGPFAVFGHSMGAIVAYEFVRALARRYDRHPVHLFVSGRGAPQFGPGPGRIPYDLPDTEFIAALRALDGTPIAALEDGDLKDLFLPIIRADFQLVQTYRFEPGAPLACPISALGGLKDDHVPREHLLEWRTHTSGPFRMTMLPGGHFFINESVHVVCQFVAAQLARSAPRGATRPAAAPGRSS
jgi:medium-chain acyl-[acyl-carrier-protein] hydrolase